MSLLHSKIIKSSFYNNIATKCLTKYLNLKTILNMGRELPSQLYHPVIIIMGKNQKQLISIDK